MHSIELLLDDDTDAAIRRMWSDLGNTAVRPARGAPHITVTVARTISPEVDALLAPVAQRLPIRVAIGAPLLFGTGPFVLALLVVPSTELLSVHAQVHRVGLPYLTPGPEANAVPGAWTPHITLARGLTADNVAPVLRSLTAPPAADAQITGLRRWDGDQREEFVLSGRSC